MASKNVLIVNGSPRPRGNCAWLTSRIVERLHERQIPSKVVQAVSLRSVNNGCIGCEGCQRSKEFRCVFKDDVQLLVASMPEYDYVLFATPVYFFGPTAQTKLVLDRMFSLIKTGPDGRYVHPFSERTKFGLVVTAGGGEDEGCDLVVEMFRRTAETMDRPLSTYLMPEAPLTPDEIENPEDYQKGVEDFCRRLTS